MPSLHIWPSFNRTLKAFLSLTISATEWSPVYLCSKSPGASIPCCIKDFMIPTKKQKITRWLLPSVWTLRQQTATAWLSIPLSRHSLWKGSREQPHATPVGVALRCILNSFQFTHSTGARRAHAGCAGHDSRHKERGKKWNSTTLILWSPQCRQ